MRPWALSRPGAAGPGKPRRGRPGPFDAGMVQSHWLDELALDPRAYEFDHPANKRPNYHFGQWDPHRIDNAGRYRRFVVQQVTLDAILDRVVQRGRLAYEEVLWRRRPCWPAPCSWPPGSAAADPAARFQHEPRHARSANRPLPRRLLPPAFGRTGRCARRAAAGRGPNSAPALRRRPATPQPATGEAPRGTVAASAPGPTLRRDGLHRGGRARGGHRGGPCRGG